MAHHPSQSPLPSPFSRPSSPSQLSVPAQEMATVAAPVNAAPPATVSIDEVWSPMLSMSNTPDKAASEIHLSDSSTGPSSVDGGDGPSSTTQTRLEGDVAIVGLAVRAAGGNNSPEKLWQFLLDKKNASGQVPHKRWEPWLRRDVRNAKEIEKTLDRGYFIEDLENFDAAFFGISPKEAEQMDPHQRLGLELSWEALEHAGIDPKSLAGSNTAVFMGIDSDDYSRLLLEDLPNIEAWMGIGSAPHGVPNRISYHFDLMGPSVAVDAACAASLAAVHMGRHAILNRESEVAIVGGVNVLLAPALTRMLGKAGALSPDGFCRSFDDGANGYARGEGGAVIILKRLETAIADGDNILATLKGSAIAQDGKTNGIMAPNARAQELVGRLALERAGVDPLSVGYVEGHVTATPLGDPTEMSALTKLYGVGSGRQLDSPVAIGSIKPNVGHLEAAAGAIGFVKAVLAVHKGQLAPQALLEKLTRKVDWPSSGLLPVHETRQWLNPGGPRRAAICSYGYGGTVSHAIIEEFNNPRYQGPVRLLSPGPVTLILSASQEKRLPEQAKALAEWLDSPEGRSSDLGAVANTLAQRRAQYDYRAAFVVASHDEAISALKSLVSNPSSSHELALQGRALGSGSDIDRTREAVWVFSGHGAQWERMGRELLSNPVFREAIADLELLVQEEAGFSVTEAFEQGNFVDASEMVQILTYVIQIGFSQVLNSRGLEPQAVIGHSVGEIAASVVAGCLTPLEGALIVTRRAMLYAKVRDQSPGGMALVNKPFAEIAEELRSRTDLVAAIDSSPTTCVVSGEAAAIESYIADLKARGIKTFRVKTDVAFHSPMLEQIDAPLREALEGSLQPRPPVVPLYSTSNLDSRSDALRDVDYWVNNMISPVQLKSAVSAALDDGHRIFVEISARPIVLHSINETIVERGLDEEDFATIATMKRDASAVESVQRTVAQLYVKGAPIDTKRQFGHKRWWCKGVPGTVWAHKPYYRQVETGPLGQGATHDVEKHTLLGQRIAVAGTDTVLFTTQLDDKTKPFPGTHPLDGTEIIPAAVYINTFHHATGASVLDDIQLRIPVSMSAETRDLQIIVQGNSISVASSAITKPEVAEQTWVSHSSARWSNSPGQVDTTATTVVDVDAVKKRIGTILPNSFSVDYLTKIGVAGIAFPWQVIEHYGNEAEMMVKVDMDPSVEKMPWDADSWGPILDAATSVGSTIFFNDPKLRIVSQIDRVFLLSKDPPPKIGYLHVEEAADSKSPASHVSVLNEAGELLAKFQSMRFSEVEGASGVSGSVDSLVHRMAWIPPKFRERPRSLEHVVLVSQDPDILQTYANQLESYTKTLVQAGGARDLEGCRSVLGQKGSVIIYVPRTLEADEDISAASQDFIWETTSIVKFLATNNLPSTLFVLTNRVHAGDSSTGLAHGALYGLGRIIAQEHPDIWGSLVDNENPALFPLLAVKYVADYDIIRVTDGLPRRAIMRPLTKDLKHKTGSNKTLLPKPEGTYIVTGGLGDLGLETLSFLAEKGARRIVAISRTGLPSRRTWSALASPNSKISAAVKRIQELEKLGVSIFPIALDISAPGAHERLLDILDSLSLPPVQGVVHAAGVLEDSLVLDTRRDSFARVLAPKIGGALTLHNAFPPGTLDFFVLYSSIGQLVGTAGQASYGSGNAFLDALATHRRARGDNAVAFQFTAVRGLGMATSTEFLTVELQSKGITDISRDEVFRAWEHLDKYDVEGAVVTRCLPVEEGQPTALPLLDDVVVRRPRAGGVAPSAGTELAGAESDATPTDPKELEKWLNVRIRECIAAVLMMSDIDDIDARAPVADLGVDSVMTVALRQKLQAALKVKVPPTLTWNHPTVNHLVPWFAAKMAEAPQ